MKNDPNFEKNYFMAIALSALVLFVYFAMVKPHPAPVETKAAETAAVSAEQTAPAAAVTAAAPKAEAVAERVSAQLEKIESRELAVEFSTLGGTISSLYFKGEPGREHLTATHFFEGSPDAPGILSVSLRGLAEHTANSAFKKLPSAPGEAVYVYEEAGIFRLTKTYRLEADHPAVDLRVDIENLSPRERVFPLELSYAFDYQKNDRPKPGEYFEAIAFTNGIKSANVRKIEKKGFWLSEPAAWTALVKNYFALIVRPDRKISEIRAEAQEGKLHIKNEIEPLTVAAGAASSVRFKIYAGAQRYETLKKFEDGFESVMSRGFFGVFKVWLLRILKISHKFTHNFGWDIVILTLLIKITFLPLTLVSSKSMKKMQALAPKQKALQEKFKNDPQRMQMEMMGLYKRNKVNPLAGCLPMLIQLPILIAMFRLLPEAIELHGAPFIFWIQDLSAPDHLFKLPFVLPILGEWFNLLPILMMASQLGYQKMMPAAMAQPEQQMVMNIMPFFFGFICWSFASGLVLYWIFQNVFSMIQQLWINRIQTELHPDDRE